MTIAISYNEEMPVTIRRFPTDFEINELKKFRHKLVDDEARITDNEITIKIFFKSKRNFSKSISGGNFDFYHYYPPRLHIDVYVTYPEEQITDLIKKIIKQLCVKYWKPPTLFPGRYSINCTVDDIQVFKDEIQDFLLDFASQIENNIDSFKVTDKKKEINAENLEICDRCGGKFPPYKMNKLLGSKIYCEKCYEIEKRISQEKEKMESKITCDRCDKEIDKDFTRKWTDEEGNVFNYCLTCYEIEKNLFENKKSIEKDIFNTKEKRNKNHGSDNLYNYKCAKCGKKIRPYESKFEDSKPFCSDCYEEKSKIPTNLSEEIYRGKVPRDISLKEWLEQKNNNSKKNRKQKTHIPILLYVLILGAIISVSLAGYSILDANHSIIEQDIKSLENEVMIMTNNLDNSKTDLSEIESELASYQNYLDENITLLQSLKEGDIFQLHNPLFEEAINFISKDTSETDLLIIENAKQQGLRCAYVEIRVFDGIYTLIAFDTIDEGMIYFEPVTDYRVFPVVGESYVDCVENEPYYSMGFDTIEEILIFW